MISQRLSRRLLVHHLPLGLGATAAAFLLYITRPYPDVITRLTFATAYPALILLGVTLAIGPWRMLRGRPVQSSMDVRRDIGIWAGIFGIFHAGVGQFEHLRGRPWLYYIYDNWQEKHVQPFRHDMFGFANDTGLIAALVLLALLATSNDIALRKLGTPGWKKLQRWNYACFGFAALHTIAYLTGVKSLSIPWLVVAATAILLTILFQTIVYLRRRRARAMANVPA
ncbi:MAG TPA: ferric reductase-like transmembrane domain-containing protein [Rhizomicrobium sp.]|nr:ferric reductase-like transmembrane domain-containing protein [Rhizomicrobium sp.]